ncbi:hypothetical protein SAMN04489735_10034 [Aneurinibacillus thermoaerophilus]|uniref:Uncharacterized protein n=1 Tax=Aneurinibacillus thermoaerophilus TaxID=143495 RepID=A0A1G7X522_ANETH|nr:hypothetical protein SAMN04489735_10034 [Aneurinibacillus thermoaerophilus]
MDEKQFVRRLVYILASILLAFMIILLIFAQSNA